MNVSRKLTSISFAAAVLATIGAACGPSAAQTIPAVDDGARAAQQDADAVSTLDRAVMDLERNASLTDVDEVTTLDRMVKDMVRNLTPSDAAPEG